MKFATILASLLLTGSAFAINANSSWKEIKADRYSEIDAPQVRFATSAGTTILSVLDTCYDEAADQMRSLNKVMTYNRETQGDNDIFVPAGKKYLYTGRTYEREICVSSGDNCHEWEIITEAYNLNPAVEVRALPTGDRSFGRVLFTKKFSVPACN